MFAQHGGFRKALALLADLAHLAVLAVGCGAAHLAITLAPSRAAAHLAGHMSTEVFPRALLT